MANKKQGQQEEETELGIGDLILVGATDVRQGREGSGSSRRGDCAVFSMAQGPGVCGGVFGSFPVLLASNGTWDLKSPRLYLEICTRDTGGK